MVDDRAATASAALAAADWIGTGEAAPPAGERPA